MTVKNRCDTTKENSRLTCSGYDLNKNSVTTPNCEEPPRIAQKRSVFSVGSHFKIRPSATTTVASRILSAPIACSTQPEFHISVMRQLSCMDGMKVTYAVKRREPPISSCRQRPKIRDYQSCFDGGIRFTS